MTRPTPLAPHTPEAFAALVRTQAQAFRRTSPDDLIELGAQTLATMIAYTLADLPPGKLRKVEVIDKVMIACQSLTNSTPIPQYTPEKEPLP